MPQLVLWKLADLRRYPALVHCRIDQTLDAGDQDSGMFTRPLVIDQDGNIIEGEARFAQAKALGHTTILCLVYTLNKEQSLRYLLELATHHDRLNKYCRVILADTLAFGYTKRAQKIDPEMKSDTSDSVIKRVGKGVLTELAQLGGVSIGTYRNARFIRDRGIPRLQEYAQAGKISIHRAYGVAQEDEETQKRLLDEYLGGSRTAKAIVERLINSSRPAEVSFASLLNGFRCQIEKLRTNQPVRELCDKVSQILNEIEKKLKSKEPVDEMKTEASSRSTRSEVAEEKANCARAPGAEGLPATNAIDLLLETKP